MSMTTQREAQIDALLERGVDDETDPRPLWGAAVDLYNDLIIERNTSLEALKTANEMHQQELAEQQALTAVLRDLVERAVPFVDDRSVDSEARKWLRDVRGEETE